MANKITKEETPLSQKELDRLQRLFDKDQKKDPVPGEEYFKTDLSFDEALEKIVKPKN